ncbi:Similar to alpha-1,2-galactosyltransferase gmh3 [Schizosaccharomyces japonicus yFS275]; acc. no. XP_002174998 [Pyronema omphalodes CBS 100304]|uniref:Similar to alpha-1,2-galactosyltransferase gmh3 [Schizosaccharomyces japonicus yFS275] acc. no. XP_002174998 n=1 Tax=Pyronema omphalodes (strain CBS 100304) TaxID=1076935 RepID=U4KZW1_PYROM|nr:Similar to alpha-1,2-galactosyltransferase gmh3 [Schizosaccharomyces japonicus yFS275]; acc. no. XP_002174998 [Pyronema omphalodes CBS 100304]
MLLPKDRKGDNDYGFHKEWLEMASTQCKQYAKHHGYRFMWADISEYKDSFSVDPMWAKIAALQDAFDKHPEVEWIWCLDADAILMNSELGLWDHLLSPEAMMREVKPEAEIKFGGDKKLPLHKTPIKTSKIVIPENIFIIVSTDFNGINAGSFFVRRNSFMSAFVDLWHDPYIMQAKFTFSEQDGLSHLIMSHPHVLKHVGVMDQCLINSYPSMYKDHELVVHFAGCRMQGQELCDKQYIDFWNRRMILPQNTTDIMED